MRGPVGICRCETHAKEHAQTHTDTQTNTQRGINRHGDEEERRGVEWREERQRGRIDAQERKDGRINGAIKQHRVTEPSLTDYNY